MNRMTEPNPFQDPLRFRRRVPPCAIVIFGANGDLTKRKLIPALYRLAYDRRIPPGFFVVGNSRTAMSDDQFREKMRESLPKFLEDTPFDETLWNDFARNLSYVAGDLNDPACYTKIGEKIANSENALFYLSTQPSHYETVIEQIGAAGLGGG